MNSYSNIVFGFRYLRRFLFNTMTKSLSSKNGFVLDLVGSLLHRADSNRFRSIAESFNTSGVQRKSGW